MCAFRASTSVGAKSCIIEKVTHFAHFDPKKTHISRCKIVNLCTINTITMHIYMVTVALHFLF